VGPAHDVHLAIALKVQGSKRPVAAAWLRLGQQGSEQALKLGPRHKAVTCTGRKQNPGQGAPSNTCVNFEATGLCVNLMGPEQLTAARTAAGGVLARQCYPLGLPPIHHAVRPPQHLCVCP
jgi:hypothetical protein